MSALTDKGPNCVASARSSCTVEAFSVSDSGTRGTGLGASGRSIVSVGLDLVADLNGTATEIEMDEFLLKVKVEVV